MLSQKNRIQKKDDIERIFKKGKSFKEGSLLLKTLKNDLDASRFGFVVSKKISKKAHIRNKIKRRLREIIRLEIKLLKPGTDNLFVALPGLEKKEKFEDFKEIVGKLLKKADILP
ncbi:MAG TPA: ribonuclease P protein component [Patescibacteria group bacterium]|nr:ribonuclease P protein component [Patescibacteria group bacterium]